MELDPSHDARARTERYAQWEKAAPLTCVALAIAAMVSAYTFRPNPFVIVGPFIGGLAFFFCWRAALHERDSRALAHAVAGIIAAMSGVVFAGNVGKLVMLSQSFPWLGLGLFLPIWFARRRHPAL